jgi:hypothetical protein
VADLDLVVGDPVEDLAAAYVKSAQTGRSEGERPGRWWVVRQSVDGLQERSDAVRVVAQEAAA